MVDPNPSCRTELEDILRSPWLNEVNNLTKEEEDNIREELEKIYIDKIKTIKEINIEEYVKKNSLITRSFINYENAIFQDKKLKPKKISKDRLEVNQCIRLNGDFKEVNFMNSLGDKIIKGFKNAFIKVKAKENLSMEVSFEYDEEEEEDEEEYDEERKINDIGDCKMMIELFEYEEGGFLLEFRRKGGRLPYYYHLLLKIQEIITGKILYKNN